MYKSLAVRDRMELMKHYKNAYPNFSYREMVDHFNDGGRLEGVNTNILEEREFQKEYRKYSDITGNSRDPYEKEHQYNYRKLFNETGGITPHLSNDNHLPSEYKELGHENKWIKGIDTAKQYADGGKLEDNKPNYGKLIEWDRPATSTEKRTGKVSR